MRDGNETQGYSGAPDGRATGGGREQGKDGQLRLQGWSRHRRIVILRRRVERSLALTEHDDAGHLRLSFAEIDDGREVWEYAVLVTSLDRRRISAYDKPRSTRRTREAGAR
jgi:hypothetical protein